MSDIPPINGVPRLVGAPVQPKAEAGSGTAGRQSTPGAGIADRVEISEMGQLLCTLQLEADIRVDKVTQIREAIATGTYETEAKLDYTVGRLLAILRSQE